jgi:hypothetical protein
MSPDFDLPDEEKVRPSKKNKNEKKQSFKATTSLDDEELLALQLLRKR